jgi:hypothetical protein
MRDGERPAGAESGSGGAVAHARRALSKTAAFGGRHWLFLLVLIAGVALRGIAFVAYRPALVERDSFGYILRANELSPPAFHPLGYAVFLRLIPFRNDLAAAAFLQHLLGLVVAGLIYAVLLRLEVRRWVAALAAAPVLLDPFQLDVEQHVMSETLFELLVLLGCILLLWRRPVGTVSAGLAGLLFAAATLTRGVGFFVIVPAVLAVLFVGARPSRGVALLALLGAFALPLAGYATWFQSLHGRYALSDYDGRFLYGRVASFADCAKFSVPPVERVLCPRQPVGQRPTADEMVWGREVSPLYDVRPAKRRNELARDFSKRVITHQPFTYVRAVAGDFVRGFAPTRTSRASDPAASKWQFQTYYPVYSNGALCPPEPSSQPCQAEVRKWDRFVWRHSGEHIRAAYAPASFLHAYTRFVYTPGPLLAAALLAGLAAALGVGRARRSGLRSAAFLFSGVGVALLLGAVALTHFSWRYQLPQLVFLPASAAVAATALKRKADAPETAASEATARIGIGPAGG